MCSEHCFGFCRSSAFSCTCSCMADMVATAVMRDTTKPLATGAHHERRNTRLWPVEPCHRQLRRFHLVRIQLLQAADGPRLAIVWRVQRLSGCAVHGDVRLPADHLFPLGLAAEPL